MTTSAARSTAPPLSPAAADIAPATVLLENPRVLLHGIRWETYEALLTDLADRRIRLTYDHGSLEIMAPLCRHENYADTLGQFVRILAEELNIDFKAAGSTTFRLRPEERGLEPDRCFYIQHAVAIVGKMELDLAIDPPPDLAIEIDITSSSLDRMAIYGSLGVPEVWRYDGEQLRAHRRKRDGAYRPVAKSVAFPTLPVTEVLPLLDQVARMTAFQMDHAVRAWVRAHAMPKS